MILINYSGFLTMLSKGASGPKNKRANRPPFVVCSALVVLGRLFVEPHRHPAAAAD